MTGAGQVDGRWLRLRDVRWWERERANALAVLSPAARAALGDEQPRGWRRLAACLGVDPEVWFPPRRQNAQLPALRICRDCPVCRPCLASALLVGEEHGVWGGQLPPARARLRQALKDGVPAAVVLDAAEHGGQWLGEVS